MKNINRQFIILFNIDSTTDGPKTPNVDKTHDHYIFAIGLRNMASRYRKQQTKPIQRNSINVLYIPILKGPEKANIVFPSELGSQISEDDHSIMFSLVWILIMILNYSLLVYKKINQMT